MNTELFIAQRLYKERNGERRLSKPAIIIAQWGVAIGIMIMIISICIVVGFKQEIRKKIIGFGGHIQIESYEAINDGESPVTITPVELQQLSNIPGIKQVEKYVNKPALAASGNEFEGIMLKGIGEGYDASFFSSYIEEGEIPHFSDTAASNKIVLSRNLANRLNAKIGNKINIYFAQNGIKARRMILSGIYNTNFSDLDNILAITDIYTTQRVNGWEKEQCSGIAIELHDGTNIEEARSAVVVKMEEIADKHKQQLYAQTVDEVNPALFAWLELLDQTVWIILVLVVGIAGFTMISGLLILILEKTSLIGILKAIGAKNISIRKIFLYYGIFIIGKGIIYGNIIGIILCLLQQQFGIVGLEPEMYYMNSVPIEFSWTLLPMNIAMFIISVAMLILPSMFISRIEPSKAIKFE